MENSREQTTSLGSRIVRTYLVVVAATVVLAVWAVGNFAVLGSMAGELLERNFRSVRAGQAMIEAAERQDSAQILYVGGEVQHSAELSREHHAAFLQAMTRAQDNLTEPGEEVVLHRIEEAYERYRSLDTDLRESPGGELSSHYFEEARPAFADLKAACRALIALNQEAMDAIEKRSRARARSATNTTAVLALLALGLAVRLGSRLSSSIVGPLQRLVEGTRRVGEGDEELRVPEDALDELGLLAREFNHMVRRVRDYQALNLERLVRERRKADAIVDSLNDPLVVADHEGRISVLNPAAEKLLGVSDRGSRGARVQEVLRDEALLEPVLATLEAGVAPAPDELETPYVVRDGGRDRAYRRRVTPVRREDGRSLGVVLVLQDVTHLHELDQMKSDLVSAVSHEFRTPLASMEMAVELMLEGSCGELDARQRELLDGVKADVVRLSRLVESLLDLSRIEAGKLELEVREVPLDSIVEPALEPFRGQAEERGVTIVQELDPGASSVRADPTKIAWVLGNLVGNALRYTPRGGTVSVEALPTAHHVRIQVTDTGPGVPEHLREKVFEKFFQVRKGRGGTPGGVGLGLAIAREMVQAHGGRMWVEEGPEGGARFVFTLPAGGGTGQTS